MSILYGSRVTIFQGHLFIVHFRLAQLTFTVNNHQRKLLPLSTFVFLTDHYSTISFAHRYLLNRNDPIVTLHRLIFLRYPLSRIDDRALKRIHNRRWRTRCVPQVAAAVMFVKSTQIRVNQVFFYVNKEAMPSMLST